MKKKMSYVPLNLFMNLFAFFAMFIFLQDVCKLSLTVSLIGGLVFYIYEVINASNKDYMEDRIKNLEEIIKKNENKLNESEKIN